MSYKLIIHTRPDGLVQPVKIAFTLTPADAKQPTFEYEPVVRWVKEFPKNSQSDQVVEWGVQLAYSTYEKRMRNGREYCDIDLPGNKPTVAFAGQSRAMTSPPTRRRSAAWAAGTPYVDYSAYRQGCFMAANETGKTQNLALLVKESGNPKGYGAIAGYYSVDPGGRCVIPSELRLQGYVVNDLGIQVNDILLRDDKRWPLFSTPLSCDSLPTSSIWKLSQDHDKVIHLRNENEPELGFGSTDAKLDTLVKLITDMKTQLSDVEKSVVRARNDSTDIRKQLAVMQRPTSQPLHSTLAAASSAVSSQKHSAGDPRIPILEAQMAQLLKSVASTQHLLSSVQKDLQEANLNIPAVERQPDDSVRSAHTTTTGEPVPDRLPEMTAEHSPDS